MLIAHQEDPIAKLRKASTNDPLRVLMSGCLVGELCGVDGTDSGMGGCVDHLRAMPALQILTFCPEDSGLGTPRTLPDLHFGDGFDVLDGTARVKDEFDNDLTAGLLEGSLAMVRFAQEHRIELAILTEMSGACGSQVVSDGCRLVDERKYQKGVGLAAAMLLRAGFPVVSQRDFRTLNLLQASLDSNVEVDASLLDHHQTPWYLENFGSESASIG